MYTSKVTCHEIDLSTPGDERWQSVIVSEGETAKALARQALMGLPEGSWRLRALSGLFSSAYALFGGRYREELRSWARALDVPTGIATLINCSYELSHLAECSSGITSRIFGCTAGVRWVEGLGMVHIRSLDWPLSQMGAATRLFRFVGGPQEFMSVGIPGFVGVLSGMVPHSYSVTINWAPPVRRPTFDWGPAFLLREVLTHCSTFGEAVEVLSTARLSTSVFFMVCGIGMDEACVIERTRKDAAIRRMKSEALIQANHHVAEAFKTNNTLIASYDTDSLFACSSRRAVTMKRGLRRLDSAQTLYDMRKPLTTWPVQNEDSVQQMVFCPERGQVAVWRKTA